MHPYLIALRVMSLFRFTNPHLLQYAQEQTLLVNECAWNVYFSVIS